MGRDLTLYPKQASRAELKGYLESLGFKKTKHLWDWPRGTLNYAWFEPRDYKSIDGVSADIYPVEADKIEKYGNGWALHVRNLYSASWFDVVMLNDVLRGARRRFGGTIRGDYGTNKYAPLWQDTSTPISRGIAATLERVDQAIRAVKFSLPAPAFEPRSTEQMDSKAKQLIEFTNSFDPSRIIYNGLVPFAVAMFEYFFSKAFVVLIAYDDFALKKRETHSSRVDFTQLLQVSERLRTVEEIIAESFTFQNLQQLNKAYKEWLNIDVRAILFKRKKLGRKVAFLENRIAEIIEYRHGVVHRFELDQSLTKDGYISILESIEASIDEFVKFLEAKYRIRIERP
jgi:hypothetical protein